jgi:feruloyl esterase
MRPVNITVIVASLVVLGIGAPFHAAFAQIASAASCQALAGGPSVGGGIAPTANIKRFAQIPDAPTSIISAKLIPEANGSPEYCRVEGQIAPTIGFVLQLPTADWNGKVMMGGCGGPCGRIPVEGANPALSRHYAVVSTDMGHKGLGWLFADQNLQAEIDFGTRSTHLTAVVAKDIVDAYYGKPPAQTYFNGCSTGGRQAMVEAQKFPEDFSGIIGGAPPYFETGDTPLFLSWGARANIDADGKPIVDASKLPMIHQAVLKSCGPKDGLTDGPLMNPQSCKWDPSEIMCKGDAKGDSCLTLQEADVVRKIYDGATNSKGRKLYFGMSRGSEMNWAPYFINSEGKPSLYLSGFAGPGNSIMTYAAFFYSPGPKYAETDFNYDTDLPKIAVMESLYNAQNPDLRAFKEAGGKFILYHGWDDNQIPAAASVDYYQMVTRAMGGEKLTKDFIRLFMLPGVGHCRGGVGGSEVDWITALEDWVENGKAPEAVTAYHMATDPYKPLTVGSETVPQFPRYPLAEDGFDRSRPVYPYPDIARYSGKGDPNKASSWEKAPAR